MLTTLQGLWLFLMLVRKGLEVYIFKFVGMYWIIKLSISLAIRPIKHLTCLLKCFKDPVTLSQSLLIQCYM